MALKVNHVRVMITVTAAEKMVEAHFIKRGRGSIGGNMTANVWMKTIGFDNHRHGVPTDVALNPPLNFPVAGIAGLVLARNGIDVGSANHARNCHSRVAEAFGEFVEE